MADERNELKSWRVAGLVATLAIVLSVPLYLLAHRLRTPRVHAPPAPLFVGSGACGECHKKEFASWKESNHALAMLAPRPGTVLGDFDDTTFEEHGQPTRFTRKGSQYWVHTPGPGGVPGDYEIAYTFGWFPLQQYLVAFPGGRLQCLSIAWDVKKGAWFSLYRDQKVPPNDWLYWTRPAMNWNTMCSQCHSTGVQKRYDPAADSFQTTWSEISVGCEACHGPGSLHAAWGRKPAMARPEVENALLTVKTTDMAQREVLNLCMPCHSRRAEFKDLNRPAGEPLETHLPTLLAQGLYHPDGQILDEDYEYQSFLQSKMFEKGVKCNDCHDVHRAKRTKEGNGLCLKCHQADTYDTESHHFHKKMVDGRASEGASCPACHMPGRNYMVVHFRRDHSIRVPRPDLSEELGTPNACTQPGCHAGKPLAWSVSAYGKWYGAKRKPHYGTVISAARDRRPEARADLLALASDPLRPAIVRATAMDSLWAYPGEDTAKVLRQALMDEDALIRRTALSRMATDDPKQLVKVVSPMLKDPVLGVRIEAASRLAGVAPDLFTKGQANDLNTALEEYQKSLDFAADMPSGRYNKAILAQTLGEFQEAEKQYRKALEFDDQFYMAQVNLALLLNQQGRNTEAEAFLLQALKVRPGDATISFNLGLLLAEEGKEARAEEALRAALRADPTMAQAAYNLAVLVAKKRPAEALKLCRQASDLRPDESKYAFTCAYFQIQAGDASGAEKTLKVHLQRHPAAGEAALLLGELYEKSGRVGAAKDVYESALAAEGLAAEDRVKLQRKVGK